MKMTGDSLGSFLLPLLFLLIFFFSGRKKKNKRPPTFSSVAREEPLAKQTKPAPLPQQIKPASTFKRTTSYEVEKKQRRNPILSKEWNTRNSLQKAFVLSEVLKRIDEE